MRVGTGGSSDGAAAVVSGVSDWTVAVGGGWVDGAAFGCHFFRSGVGAIDAAVTGADVTVGIDGVIDAVSEAGDTAGF